MCKNISKIIYSAFLICFLTLSITACSVSTKVASQINDNEYDNANINIPVVKAENVPIIEICPPPYEIPETEKNNEKPGESYNNLLQPVISEDRDEGLLVIKTNIPDVNVSLNSRELGFSDIGITGIIPRIYILGLYKDGYKEENLFISVGRNKYQEFYVEMKEN